LHQKKKIADEQSKHSKSKSQLDGIKNDYESLKTSCVKLKENVVSKSKSLYHRDHTLSVNKINSNTHSNDSNYKPFFNHYNPYEEVINTKKSEKTKMKKKKMEDELKNDESLGSPRSPGIQSEYLSKSLIMSNNLSFFKEFEINKLFLPKEKKYLSKLVPKEALEKYEVRYEAVEKDRVEAEKKYKNEMKEIVNKISAIQENVRMANYEFKEIDQKSKIYKIQTTEYSNEVDAQQKKIVDVQKKIEILNQTLKEKTNENQMLLTHISQLKKLNQHKQDKDFQMKRRKEVDSDNSDGEEGNEGNTDTKGGYEPTEKSYDEHDEEEIMNKYSLKPQKNKGID